VFRVLFLVAGDVIEKFLESESRHAGRQPMTVFYRVASLNRCGSTVAVKFPGSGVEHAIAAARHFDLP
jgi:hypothetical protein